MSRDINKLCKFTSEPHDAQKRGDDGLIERLWNDHRISFELFRYVQASIARALFFDYCLHLNGCRWRVAQFH
jgi:hypothetical protein